LPNLSDCFTIDPEVIAEHQMHYVGFFAASPIISIQLIGAAYFQAAGKLQKHCFDIANKVFLIPLVSILPNFFGIFECGLSLIADILATIITLFSKKRNEYQTETS
jgi:Na+-driven multidrug efflux pump